MHPSRLDQSQLDPYDTGAGGPPMTHAQSVPPVYHPASGAAAGGIWTSNPSSAVAPDAYATPAAVAAPGPGPHHHHHHHHHHHSHHSHHHGALTSSPVLPVHRAPSEAPVSPASVAYHAAPMGGPPVYVPVRTPGAQAKDVERLAGMDASLLGPWFDVLQTVVLALCREQQTLRQHLGPTDELEKLNYARTGELGARPPPLTQQVHELQKLLLREINSKKAAQLLSLGKDAGKPLLQRYYSKWTRYVRKRMLAGTLLSGNGSVLRRRYYRVWRNFVRRRKQNRAADLLLMGTTHGVLLSFYHKWRRFTRKMTHRNPVARRLALQNGKLFVLRYYRKLESYRQEKRRQKKVWDNLVWIGRMCKKGLARAYYYKLLNYREQNRRKPGPVGYVALGQKQDQRNAIAHALSLTTQNLHRLVYFRKWRKWRWMGKRGGVADTMNVVRHRELINKYADKLKKFGHLARIVRMSHQLDNLTRRLDGLESRLEQQPRHHHPPPKEPEAPRPHHHKNLSPQRNDRPQVATRVMHPRTPVQPPGPPGPPLSSLPRGGIPSPYGRDPVGSVPLGSLIETMDGNAAKLVCPTHLFCDVEKKQFQFQGRFVSLPHLHTQHPLQEAMFNRLETAAGEPQPMTSDVAAVYAHPSFPPNRTVPPAAAASVAPPGYDAYANHRSDPALGGGGRSGSGYGPPSRNIGTL